MNKTKLLQKIIFYSVIGVCFIFGVGCSQKDKFEWEEIICSECFNEDNVMGNAIKESVSIKVKQTDEHLNVKINAPYICEELLAWLETVKEEEFTEENMEAKILELLKKTKKEESVCELKFSLQEDDVTINYSAEFLDVMSCGLNRFYAELNYKILEEMRGDK